MGAAHLFGQVLQAESLDDNLHVDPLLRRERVHPSNGSRVQCGGLREGLSLDGLHVDDFAGAFGVVVQPDRLQAKDSGSSRHRSRAEVKCGPHLAGSGLHWHG